MEPIISVKNLSKEYRLGTFSTGAFLTDVVDFGKSLVGGKQSTPSVLKAVNDVSFDIYDGDILGIVGGNGAGKSTILKLLSRITTPTSGTINIRGRVSSLLEVGTGFHPELTGRENIFLNGTILGMTKGEIARNLDEIVEFSGVSKFLDTPVKRYSSGMVVRLGFSVAAFLEPDILIVDEVLAVGDRVFQERCLSRLKDVSSSGKVVLFVSHNLQSLKKLCTRGLLMEKGSLKLDSTINDVLDTYLLNGNQQIQKGVIPKDYHRTVASGEVMIRRFQLLDNTSQVVNKVYFRQPLNILLEVEEVGRVTEVVFAAMVYNQEGEKVAHADKQITEFLNGGGACTFKFDLNLDLTPGKYYFSTSLYNENGGQYDFIERCYEFQVLEISFGAFDRYSGAAVSGSIYSELKMSKNIGKDD